MILFINRSKRGPDDITVNSCCCVAVNLLHLCCIFLCQNRKISSNQILCIYDRVNQIISCLVKHSGQDSKSRFILHIISVYCKNIGISRTFSPDCNGMFKILHLFLFLFLRLINVFSAKHQIRIQIHSLHRYLICCNFFDAKQFHEFLILFYHRNIRQICKYKMNPLFCTFLQFHGILYGCPVYIFRIHNHHFRQPGIFFLHCFLIFCYR